MNATPRTERLSDPTEIRFGARRQLDLPVTLAGNGLSGNGILRDLSISGALIETLLDLPVFTNVVVTLPPRDVGAPRRELVACVVRHSVTGIGLEWRDMACAALKELLTDATGKTAA